VIYITKVVAIHIAKAVVFGPKSLGSAGIKHQLETDHAAASIF